MYILDSFSCKTFTVLRVTETDEKKRVLERHTQLPNYNVNWIWTELQLEVFMNTADTREEGEASGFFQPSLLVEYGVPDGCK